MRASPWKIVLVAVALALPFAVAACAGFDIQNPKTWGTPVGIGSRWSRMSADGGADAGALAEDMTGRCKIPTHDDAYYGFSIGHPEGWHIDYSSGTIIVSKDSKNLTGALVLPSRMRRTDVTADRVADVVTDGLAHAIEHEGGTFDVTDRITDGKVAHAMMHANVTGVSLRGPIEVVETPGFVTVKAYWAPEDSFSTQESMLRQVVECFSRKTVVTVKKPVAPPGGPVTKVGGHVAPAATATAAMKPIHTRYFTLQAPQGWTVRNETANGVDLVSSDNASAVGFGWILNPASSAEAIDQDGLRRIFPGSRVLSSGPMQVPQGWSGVTTEFEAPSQGATLHGINTTALGQGVAVMHSWYSVSDRWEARRAEMEQIAASIQITDAAIAQVNANVRAQLAAYPHPQPSTASTPSSSSSENTSPMSKWAQGQAGQDKINQGFSDNMLGQDRATSPSTGEEYTVPWNAWSSTGPQGAGYYRATPGGGSELLNVQE